MSESAATTTTTKFAPAAAAITQTAQTTGEESDQSDDEKGDAVASAVASIARRPVMEALAALRLAKIFALLLTASRTPRMVPANDDSDESDNDDELSCSSSAHPSIGNDGVAAK